MSTTTSIPSLCTFGLLLTVELYLCLIGLHGPRRRPNWDRERWYQYIRSKIVRHNTKTHLTAFKNKKTPHSEDEIHPELRFTGAGILAMANSGPNTNGSPPSSSSTLGARACNRLLNKINFIDLGSQFFLTLAPTPFLDNKHTIFGRVSSGMRVLQRLGAVGVDTQDRFVVFPSLPFFLSFTSESHR